MTKFTRYSGIVITLAATACALTSTTFAATIYDNSTTYLGQLFGSPNEFGDQITFSPSTTERTLASFSFDYFLSTGASANVGNETIDLRLYANDGPGGTPGTLLYESGSFKMNTGFNTPTVNLSGLNIQVPNTITWTVLFGGIDPFETAGILMYDPPTVGSSFNDYWEKSAGVWNTKVFNDPNVKANFGAIVTAVPEPATIQLGLAGGMMLLGWVARRRFSAK